MVTATTVNSTTGPEVHALTGAYVCDALGAEERAAFEEHLAQCEACTQEVAELSETAAVLAMATALAPPERLHAAVTARIEITRQLPPLPAPAPDVATPGSGSAPEAAPDTPAAPASPADGPPATPDATNAADSTNDPSQSSGPGPGTAAGDNNVVDISQARSRRLGRFSRAAVAGWTAAAVLAGVAAGLGVQDLSQRHQISQSESHAQQLAALLAAPDVHVGVGKVHGGGTVTIVESRELNQVAVTLADMPTLPAGKAYQLWMIGPGGIRSSGVVTKAETNSSTPILAGALGTAVTLGMTVEPAHGSAQPTTTPILLLSMPA